MKRQLVLLVMMILVLSGVVMGGEEPGEVPELEAKSVILTSFDGTHIKRPNEGVMYYGGSNGFLGYSAAVEPELKPTEELVRLLQRRLTTPPLKPSGRLSLDKKERLVAYRVGPSTIELPLASTSGVIAHLPDENFSVVWSATLNSPVTTDLLIALSEYKHSGARLLIFAVQREQTDLWLVTWAPILFRPLDLHRLKNEDEGFGLYNEGDQFVLFLPSHHEDQAWEIHLPMSFDESMRFNIFPISTESP